MICVARSNINVRFSTRSETERHGGYGGTETRIESSRVGDESGVCVVSASRSKFVFLPIRISFMIWED